MIYDFQLKKLYSNEGIFIKEVICPLKDPKIERIGNLNSEVNCTQCTRSLLVTTGLSDSQVIDWVSKQEHPCLAIDLNDQNLTVINNPIY